MLDTKAVRMLWHSDGLVILRIVQSRYYLFDFSSYFLVFLDLCCLMGVDPIDRCKRTKKNLPA